MAICSTQRPGVLSEHDLAESLDKKYRINFINGKNPNAGTLLDHNEVEKGNGERIFTGGFGLQGTANDKKTHLKNL